MWGAMKIGIITYTHGTNFGQRLQNYALQNKLEELGCTVYTVKQTEPYSKFKLKIKYFAKQIKNILRKDNMVERQKMFAIFNEQYIHFYKRKLKFDGDNNWISEEFDAFIVGSDQIWSPISDYVGENAFLSFAKSNQKLTYAPSLSVNEMPKEKVTYYKGKLSDFSYISTREYKGKEILESIINREIKVVVDPTLLLTRKEWDKIRKNCFLKPNEEYCLCMFLGECPNETYKILKEKRLRLCFIDDKTPISPNELIDLIADASCVLTDSFHVTIFASFYHVDFINFNRSDFGSVMNSRFDTLYKIFGIGSRRYNEIDVYEKIDFEKLDCEVEKHRKESMEFLLEEIDKVNTIC